MIESIYIKNFGIVGEATFLPSAGFNVITGETGAGKSMIIGAISLLMGQRLSGVSMPDPSHKAILEMVVNIPFDAVVDLLSDVDIESVSPLIIRREISDSGRSRAFINDSPVPVGILSALFTRIVDLSQQHENMSLSRRESRVEMIDEFGQLKELVAQYQTYFQMKRELETKIQLSTDELNRLRNLQEFNKFQLEELVMLDYQSDELANLEAESELLSHAEEVKNSLFQSSQLIDSDERSIVALFNDLLHAIKASSVHHPKASDFSSRINAIYHEIKDLGIEIDRLFDSVDYDQERLSKVDDRISLIYKLIKKHNLNNSEDLISLRESLQGQINSLEGLEEKLTLLKKEWNKNEEKFLESAAMLTNKRQGVKNKLEAEIVEKLNSLAMPDADFSIVISPASAFHNFGADEVDFYFSANKGIERQLLTKVASGGELSRLMLAIKSVTGMKRKLPTLIFDEIDTGISGETATKVGFMMQDISRLTQLIVISHLPQIAAKATTHFLVEKYLEGDQTRTGIKKIEGVEREDVIATMLSGDKNSINARLTAREMLSS